MKNNIIRRWSLLLVCSLLVSACASNQPLSDPENDPWESYNRSIHKFNDGVDKVFLRPISSGYNKVSPAPIKKAIRNVVNNLSYPNTIINLFLQGNFADAWTSSGRFLVNSTVGLAGIFDVATKLDIPLHDEDFGQTLAVWGWENSRYFILPFFGPSTIRDGIGRLGNNYMDPVNYLASEKDIWAPWIIQKLYVRISLFPQEDAINSSYDPYIFIRDAWLQNREFRIYNGDPPALDYEAFLEE